jgi:two-component system, OmpR family, sensor histidine kinase KdpD
MRRLYGSVHDWLVRHGFITAALAIVVSTGIFLPGRGHFAKGQWALLYLLVVVIVASVAGTWPAVVAAGLAFLSWNFFFLPPYHTFVIHDIKDVLSLVAFLVVAVAMGVQTGRMRERQSRAEARGRETALLNRLSSYLVAETSTEAMTQTMLEETSRLLDGVAVTLFRADAERRLRPAGGGKPPAAVLRTAEWSYRSNKGLGLHAPDRGSETVGWPVIAQAGEYGVPNAENHDVYLPLQTTSSLEGVLHFARPAATGTPSKREEHLMVSIANLVAAFLERQRLQEALTSAEAGREADRLKSTLLSSVSHELKTPLAGLSATVSNLLEGDTEWDEQTVRDELQAVVADVTRLNNSIGALLELSRLEARSWPAHRDWYDLADIASTGLAALPAHQRGDVSVDIPEELPAVFVDYEQWARVFQHLLENAVLYAPQSGNVSVGARADGADLLTWVEDHGPGVPSDQRELIFEKFFRGGRSGERMPSGTGLGLAITREIVAGHGGFIWVEAADPHGARFVIKLPNAFREHPR